MVLGLFESTAMSHVSCSKQKKCLLPVMDRIKFGGINMEAIYNLAESWVTELGRCNFSFPQPATRGHQRSSVYGTLFG